MALLPAVEADSPVGRCVSPTRAVLPACEEGGGETPRAGGRAKDDEAEEVEAYDEER